MRKVFRRFRFLLNLRKSIPFLFAFFRSGQVSIAYKLLSGLLVVGYLVFPFDLIPDFLVFFGILDDITLLAWILQTIVKWAPESLKEKYEVLD
ncbi:YkvA family protein [Ammoniphilus sp. CFH 90114]|uniref:YkvA family protein n=1 Tax=Ammoniphilus sp. CFH 90114 TaxID=2493665 RepID=UPI00100EF7DC|nr:DUF1232 domain-containing protein [Ammoniphilus sp. CFH 90114]RXT15292.1 DUF1232 domain-containing protein [Ammoniphilus sp. CFH 90114]